MSQHEYEDLCEETIRLVLLSGRPPAELRRIVGGIYRFQDLFDTSDTVGRLHAELQQIGYFDDPVEPATLLETVALAMTEAQARGDRMLGHDWLAVLAEAVSSFVLDGAFPETFEALRAAPEIAVIRAAGRALDLQHDRRAKSRFRLKKWNRYAEGSDIFRPESVERKHKLRLIADLGSDDTSIESGYQADRRKAASFGDSPVMRLAEIVPDYGPFALVGRETRTGFWRNEIFVFEIGERPTDPEAARRYLIADYDASGQELSGQIGMQSGLLLGWQGGSFGASLADMHFKTTVCFPKAYRFDKPEKALRRTLDAFFADYANASATVEFFGKPLRKLLERHDVEGLLKRQTKLRQDHAFFTNDFDVFFAYACLAWEKGQAPEALIQRILERLPAVHEDYPLKRFWREGAKALETGPWFPPLTEGIRYRDLTKG